MSSPIGTTPTGSIVASTLGFTTRVSQQNMTSIPLSLPSCLIPTEIVGDSTTFNAMKVGGMRSSSLYTQSYTSPFIYKIPPWTPTTTTNITSQPVIPSMPVVSKIPPNPFNLLTFKVSHIMY